jgi:glucosylceramidase
VFSPLRLRTAALLFVICPPFFAQTVQSFRTTADLSDALKQQASATFSPRAPAAPLVIEVDDTQRFQTMEGFGISMVEGSTWLLHDRIPPAMSQQIMTHLFDPHQGIGLSFRATANRLHRSLPRPL